MNPKIRWRLETRSWGKSQIIGFSLFETLVSLALIALILTLLMMIESQTVKTWRDLNNEEELMREGQTLLQMICCDLRSALFCSKNLQINCPFISCQKNIFFLRRTSSDDLVAVGYFLDSNKQGTCYRFFAKANETLMAQNEGALVELEARAVAKKVHSELIATHLLSWEMNPIWNNEQKMILLEINLAFEKATSRYFLSTVVALPL